MVKVEVSRFKMKQDLFLSKLQQFKTLKIFHRVYE